MPIPLGVLAVAGAGGGAGGAGAYELLESEILTGTVASITFDNLNSTYGSTYQHLQIRITSRTNQAANQSVAYMRFNSDSGANYSRHYLYSNTSISSVQSDASVSVTEMEISNPAGGNATANVFDAAIIDILDPFETTKYKTIRTLQGLQTYNRIGLQSGSWRNTAALTDILIAPYSGSFVSGSRFSLYGLRSA